MLIILFGGIIIFLSDKSRPNRVRAEASGANWAMRCGGGAPHLGRCAGAGRRRSEDVRRLERGSVRVLHPSHTATRVLRPLPDVASVMEASFTRRAPAEPIARKSYLFLAVSHQCKNRILNFFFPGSLNVSKCFILKTDYGLWKVKAVRLNVVDEHYSNTFAILYIARHVIRERCVFTLCCASCAAVTHPASASQ